MFVKRLLVALGLVIAACGGSEIGSQTTLSSQGANSTATTLSYVAEGELLYLPHCGLCHGIGGVGTDAGPALTDEAYHEARTTDVDFLVSVTDGVDPGETEFAGMAAIPSLSHSDIGRITAYVRSLQDS